MFHMEHHRRKMFHMEHSPVCTHLYASNLLSKFSFVNSVQKYKYFTFYTF